MPNIPRTVILLNFFPPFSNFLKKKNTTSTQEARVTMKGQSQSCGNFGIESRGLPTAKSGIHVVAIIPLHPIFAETPFSTLLSLRQSPLIGFRRCLIPPLRSRHVSTIRRPRRVGSLPPRAPSLPFATSALIKSSALGSKQ